ncbi:hypothetical protein Tcan_00739, partial [Toxocara canis]
ENPSTFPNQPVLRIDFAINLKDFPRLSINNIKDEAQHPRPLLFESANNTQDTTSQQPRSVNSKKTRPCKYSFQTNANGAIHFNRACQDQRILPAILNCTYVHSPKDCTSNRNPLPSLPMAYPCSSSYSNHSTDITNSF